MKKLSYTRIRVKRTCWAFSSIQTHYEFSTTYKNLKTNTKIKYALVTQFMPLVSFYIYRLKTLKNERFFF